LIDFITGDSDEMRPKAPESYKVSGYTVLPDETVLRASRRSSQRLLSSRQGTPYGLHARPIVQEQQKNILKPPCHPTSDSSLIE
jgi:hypothetical protein